jgi:hypothetical protein
MGTKMSQGLPEMDVGFHGIGQEFITGVKQSLILLEEAYLVACQTQGKVALLPMGEIFLVCLWHLIVLVHLLNLM